MVSERTPLRQNENVPPYVFITNHNRAYKNKIRKFQCCICAAFLAIFITALVITVSYTVNHEMEEEDNLTAPTAELNTLLTLTWPLPDKPYDVWDEPLNDTEINLAIDEGKKLLDQKELFEEKVPTLQMNSPSYRHQMSTKTLPEARILSRSGFIMEGATKHLARRRRKGNERHIGRGPRIHLNWLPAEVCNESVPNPCSTSSYRSADGSCNNLKHPRTWGVAMRPFRRHLPPEYGDGISAPRKSRDGTHLPSARDVSLTVHRPFYRDDPNFTVMLAVWGQFIDHDITATALSQGKGGSPISCCNGYFQSGLVTHPECYTVTLESPDPYYEQYNVTCMEFVRSSPAPMCSFGPREQMNQASSFLDGSVVYGTSKKVMDQLRTFEGGELKMLRTPDGQELLPVSTDSSDGCNQEEQLKQGRYCFLSGDARANENIHLTSMHLLLARQHNKIARKLALINPGWDDEKLFQESRKIVAAQIQHITYNEFLPVILGPRLMSKLKMAPNEKTFSSNYDSELDPSIANSFAASAFRFGHTLLPGLVQMIAGDNSSKEYVEMHKMLFNPFQLYDKGFLEKSVRGAINTSVERVDTYFNTEFTQHLFERKPSIGRPKGMCGLDLVSLNVQRGRDHGLPGYPAFREHCGLKRPKTFEDLKPYMDEGSWDRITEIYKTVDDIDMYSGALAELPLNGSLVGPTVTCILTDQFLRLQRGDRFWYETSEQPQAFTKDQLKAIKQTSLAKIICDTSDVNQVQPLVMRGLLNGNDRKACNDIPEVDFTSWKENPRVSVDNAPGKVWLIKGPMPKKPRLIKLGGSVSSGSLTLNGNTIWSGSLPLNLPTKPFDTFAQSSELPELSYPPIFAHGILWNGSVTVSDGKASINGQLSVPQYIHSLNNESNIVWYNGEFSLSIETNWNSFQGVPTSLTGQFTTPLYFHNNAEFANISSSNAYSVAINPSATPEQELNENVAPLVLIGAYSSDGNSFVWPGNVTLMIPSEAPAAPEVDNLKLAYTPKSYVKRVRIGGKITTGKITAQGYNVWNGELPLAIPVDPFDTVAGMDTTNSDEPIIYGHGINWQGSLTKIDATANTADITAQFSLPRFVHSNGITPFAIQWYNGDATLHLDIGWWSDCEKVLNYEGIYTTSVYFGSRKSYDYLKDSEPAKSLQGLDIGYAGSPKLYEKGLNAPLILLGSYSDDGKTFFWSGNVTLVIPKVVEITPPVPTNLMAVKPQPKLRVPLRLVGGQVNVGGWNVWYNSLPLGVPLKTFNSVSSVDVEAPILQHSFGKSIIWNGSISIVDSYNIKLHGIFSFPQFNDVTKNITWLNGNFDLQFQSNTTFDINGNFKTSLFFAERSTYETLRNNSVNYVDNLEGLGVKPSELPQAFDRDVDIYGNAPMILFGITSSDKTEFLWSGDCILEVPQNEPLNTNLILTASSGVEEKTVVKVFGTVTKLSISLDGINITKTGVPPLTLPPVFDSVITLGSAANEPPVYGEGILWEGEINNVLNSEDLLLSGKFSLPTTVLGGDIKWYNGNFSFYISKAWKTFNASISNSFSSVIYLNGKKPTDLVDTKQDPPMSENAGFDSPSVSADVFGSAPMILSGEYLPDGKSFLWSGAISLFVGLKPTSALKDPIMLASNPQIRVAAFTNGGSITIDGSSVWVGNRVPLAIPLNNLGSVIRPYNGVVEKVSEFNAVLWKGFINSEAPNTIKIWGAYSLPLPLPSTAKDIISWFNGDFAFELKLLSEPESKINLSGSFKSIIYLNEMSSYSGLKAEWNITEPQNITFTPVPINKESDNVTFVPIILDGTYSADKSWFIWSGNVSTFLTI